VIFALFIALVADAEEMTKVSVLDAQLRRVKVLSTETELAEFTKLWSKKSGEYPSTKVEWSFKLDIESKSKGERWVYHPAGWVRIFVDEQNAAI